VADLARLAEAVFAAASAYEDGDVAPLAAALGIQPDDDERMLLLRRAFRAGLHRGLVEFGSAVTTVTRGRRAQPVSAELAAEKARALADLGASGWRT